MRILATSGVQLIEFHVKRTFRQGVWQPELWMLAEGSLSSLLPEHPDALCADTPEEAIENGLRWVRQWLQSTYPSFTQLTTVQDEPPAAPSGGSRSPTSRTQPRSTSA